MANENDYQSMKLSELVHHLEDLAIGNVQVIGTLEQIISNREAEINGLRQQLENLEAENRFLREQLKSEWLKIEVNK